MREPHLILIARRIGNQAQFEKAFLEHLHGAVVDGRDGCARPRPCGSFPRMQHEVVDARAARGERATYRIRASDRPLRSRSWQPHRRAAVRQPHLPIGLLRSEEPWRWGPLPTIDGYALTTPRALAHDGYFDGCLT